MDLIYGVLEVMPVSVRTHGGFSTATSTRRRCHQGFQGANRRRQKVVPMSPGIPVATRRRSRGGASIGDDPCELLDGVLEVVPVSMRTQGATRRRPRGGFGVGEDLWEIIDGVLEVVPLLARTREATQRLYLTHF